MEMSFIDYIKKELQSSYIIGVYHKDNSYFDDLRGAAGERIEDFDGKPIILVWAILILSINVGCLKFVFMRKWSKEVQIERMQIKIKR